MERNFSSIREMFVKVTCLMTLVLLISTTLWAEDGTGRRSIGFFDILSLPRVWMGGIFCLVGLGLLMKSWVRCNVRLTCLAVIFFVFSVLSVLPLGSFARGMGLHPSPVCTITRPFQFLNIGRTVPVVFLTLLAFISVFSIIGNKLFCGWVCPIGALQEIAHKIPTAKKGKLKLPFGVTNLIRALLFFVFVAVVFSAGMSLYDYFNPFEFLHWKFEAHARVVMLVVLVASVLIFRPFCYMLCPIGLFTWVLEHISLIKVRVNRDTCTECHLCTEVSPCPAVPSILEGRKSRPDCHACGHCLEVCPENALQFRK